MINCIILDDDFVSKAILVHYCEENPNTTLLSSFTDSLEALKFNNWEEIDLIFTDIEMPDCDGLEFIKKFKSKAQVVFTTSHESYALESFKHNVLDYLVKPITRERFNLAVEKFIEVRGKFETPIQFRIERKNVNLTPSKIKYFESYGDYIKIYYGDNVLISHSTMKDLETYLPENFVRIHRKYIINKDTIHSYSSTSLVIEDLELPIGKSFKGILS